MSLNWTDKWCELSSRKRQSNRRRTRMKKLMLYNTIRDYSPKLWGFIGDELFVSPTSREDGERERVNDTERRKQKREMEREIPKKEKRDESNWTNQQSMWKFPFSSDSHTRISHRHSSLRRLKWTFFVRNLKCWASLARLWETFKREVYAKELES